MYGGRDASMASPPGDQASAEGTPRFLTPRDKAARPYSCGRLQAVQHWICPRNFR